MTEAEGGYAYEEDRIDGAKIAEGSITTTKPGVPTQVAHPWKAVLRTFVAAGVGVALAWLVRVAGIDLAGLEGAIVDSITAAVWVAATGFVQWLLTHPSLIGFWTKIGLGTGVEKEYKVS